MMQGDLISENAALQARIKELESQLQFLTSHRTLATGISGETLVSKIIDGNVTSYAAPFDILDKSGQRIEVKYAKLNSTAGGTKTKRWAWGKIFGEGGVKDFDFLLLIGEKDQRWASFYKDKVSPFVFFCIPKEKIFALTMPMNGGRYRAIQLTSNPETARRSKGAALFDEFQITESDLVERFGL
jgi:hypothetical protein